nr:hypothetical protein [Tanacetum cinerariifolium]
MRYHSLDKRSTNLMMMVLVRQIEECEMMLHMKKSDMLMLVAEIEVGDKTADDVDKLACSANVVKPRQDRLVKEVLMMVLMMHTKENDTVLHIEKTGMVMLVVEIDVGGMTADVVDKLNCSSDDVQPRHMDLRSNENLRNKMIKSFPLLAMNIPLPEYFTTASEEVFPLLSLRVALAEKVCTAVKLRINHGQRHINISQRPPLEESGTGSISESSAKKKGRTVAVTTEDMQKRKNDVKARTTLLLALLDEHQSRFSNSAKKKGRTVAVTTEDMQKRKNDVKARTTLLLALLDEHQSRFSKYETTQEFGKREVNTASIPTANTQVSPAIADVATASISHDTVCTYIASQSNGSQIKYEDINQIDEDDIEEIDIK